MTWRERNNGRNDLSTRAGADGQLGQDKTARYRYQTGQEDAEIAKSTETETFALEVWASVARNDVQKARELFTKLLLDQLPEPVRTIVSGLAKSFLDNVDRHLTAITGVNASGRVFITYHVRKPTPTPSIPDPGNGGNKATMPVGCPSAAVAEFGYTSLGSETVDGVLICAYGARRTQLGVSLTGKKATTADMCADAELISIAGAETAWIDNGACGTPAVIVVLSNGTLQVTGGDGGRDELIAVAQRILSTS